MSPEAGSFSVPSWTKKTYQKDLPEDIRPFRELLEHYSHIPEDEIDAHLHRIRDKAWDVAPFPCVGMWSFTKLPSVENPVFATVIARLKKPGSQDILLDVACGLGQVLRKLVVEGVEPTKLYGTDLLSTYLDLGFDLFRDRDRFNENSFVAADLTQPDMGGIAALEGKITLAHASNFFHLFDWEQQTRIVLNLVKLLRPDAEGTIIFGGQIGRIHAGEMTSWRGGTRYLHNLDSLQEFWDEIGKKTGTAWRVDAKWLGKLPFQIPQFPEDTHYLGFAVYKLEV